MNLITDTDIERAHDHVDVLDAYVQKIVPAAEIEAVNRLSDLELEAVTLDLLAHRDRVIEAIAAGAGEFGPEIRRLAAVAIATEPEAWQLRAATN